MLEEFAEAVKSAVVQISGAAEKLMSRESEWSILFPLLSKALYRSQQEPDWFLREKES